MWGVSNVTMSNNTTTDFPTTTVQQVYWSDFGPLQYVEVVYLTIITVLGTIGNIIVMSSIALERRIHLHGNIFIINLAVADLIVSCLIVPSVIANVVAGQNALGAVFCDAMGFMVTVTCTCSLCNLMFIAINRYWAVVRSSTYQKTFSRDRVYYMVAFTWAWSALLVSPTLMGWGGLKFDPKMMVCSWDDEKDSSYTYFISAIAIFVPLVIIAVCYVKLFTTVRSSGRWVRSLSVGSGISSSSEQHRRSERKERSLLRTLLMTVFLFCVCWVPFGGCVIIDPSGTPAHAKKVFGWMALTNSCVNFIIYGAMNPVFRRGYHNLFLFIFRCKRAQQISSAMLHGSFSDSFKATKRGSKGNVNGIQGNKLSKSDNNRDDNSRIDTITGVPPAVSVVTQMTMPGNSPLMVRADLARKTNEPSPLAERDDIPAPATSSFTSSRSRSNSQQKKGIVESIRKASFLRKSRPRASTTDASTKEEDREWRAKRNSAMLLQIQMGDDVVIVNDEDFEQKQDARFYRRAMSDVPHNMQMRTLDPHSGNSANNASLDVNEISKGPLRGSWIPANTVYTSKSNTPILGRSPAPRPGSGSSTPSPKESPVKTRNGVTTVSEKIDKEVKPGSTQEETPNMTSQAPHELSMLPNASNNARYHAESEDEQRESSPLRDGKISNPASPEKDNQSSVLLS